MIVVGPAPAYAGPVPAPGQHARRILPSGSPHAQHLRCENPPQRCLGAFCGSLFVGRIGRSGDTRSVSPTKASRRDTKTQRALAPRSDRVQPPLLHCVPSPPYAAPLQNAMKPLSASRAPDPAGLPSCPAAAGDVAAALDALAAPASEPPRGGAGERERRRGGEHRRVGEICVASTASAASARAPKKAATPSSRSGCIGVPSGAALEASPRFFARCRTALLMAAVAAAFSRRSA